MPKRKKPNLTPKVPVPKGKRERGHKSKRNVGAAKRTSDQQENDEVYVADLMAQGYGIVRVHEMLNARNTDKYQLSRSMVEKDMRAVRDKWHNSQMEDLTVFINREVRLLDYLQIEALDAWQRSKGERTRTEASKQAGKGNRNGTLSKIVREGRDGNPDYLAVALKCSERRCKLLGLEPTVIANPNDPSAPLPLPSPAMKHVLEIEIIGQEHALAGNL